MANRPTSWNKAVLDYVIAVGTHETAPMRRLRDETASLPQAQMQISVDQGQLLGFLIKLTGAKRALEIGTFTGYSALAVAGALPADGNLLCCDVSETWTAIGRRYWREAGLDGKIELRIGPATETLQALLANGGTHGFDFAFIDADKPNYDAYYEACLRLVRPGGLIAIDNVLWSGAVADPDDNSESTLALKTLNAKIHDDGRVDMCLVPVSDGLTLVRPR
jgi:predicted O-methyltransferase YrrM